MTLARRLRLPVLVLLVAGSLLGCVDEPQYHYLKTSDMDAYFRVPRDWTLFSEGEFKTALSGTELPPVLQRITWASGFDASTTSPSLGNLFTPANHPVGFSEVKVLNVLEQGRLSFDELRNYVLPLDQLLQSGDAEPLDGLYDQPFVRGDLHGTRAIWAIEGDDGPFVYDQVAMFDPDRSRIFLLVFSCATDCYSDHRRSIDEIVSSLRVGEEI
jgi:hypothetical protein